jgi:hypothetical protein
VQGPGKIYEKSVSSTECQILIPGPIGKDCRVDYITTSAAFPSVVGANKIIELLSEHLSLALWAFHELFSFDVEWELYK